MLLENSGRKIEQMVVYLIGKSATVTIVVGSLHVFQRRWDLSRWPGAGRYLMGVFQKDYNHWYIISWTLSRW